jgi:hypothetical protein
MRSALIIAFLLGAIAILVALTPEILARFPRRRGRDEHHVVRGDPDAPPPPARPDLKRDDRDIEA